MNTRDRRLFGGLTAALVTLGGVAVAQVGDIPDRFPAFYHGHGMMGDFGGWGGTGWFLGPVVMVLVLAAIVVAVIWAVRLASGATTPGSGGATNPDRSMALLRERFAKGEIDAKEFEDRKRLLND